MIFNNGQNLLHIVDKGERSPVIWTKISHSNEVNKSRMRSSIHVNPFQRKSYSPSYGVVGAQRIMVLETFVGVGC